ncbi:hypothetical protein BT63DRAFT_14795 [Microthyrium microscopicum]|uniref:C2H2-type domain-containing protein n=1 Tax=Microthyrium microscopicum TaxID=703497 RepID=A0A6A6UU59_9PEZI|nr:hypothetical protein BT63DRAFT_14795 [Microthyrium microscopicum]
MPLSPSSPAHPKAQVDRSSESKSLPRPRGNELKCPQCPKTLKCRSDLAKHERWHNRPYKCDYPGCERAPKGFITQNDLDRHKKSKHFNGIFGKTKSFQCVGKNCRNPKKIWPRHDNFKQHVVKMHPNEDVEDVIKRSRIATPSPSEEEQIGTGIDPTTVTNRPPKVTITTDPERSTSSVPSIMDETHLSPITPSQRRLSRPSVTPINSGMAGMAGDTQTAPLRTLSAATGSPYPSSSQSRQSNTSGRATKDAPPAEPQLDVAQKLMSTMMTAITHSIAPSQPAPKVSARSKYSGKGIARQQAPPPAPAPQDVMIATLKMMISTLEDQSKATPQSPEYEPQAKEESGQQCKKCKKWLKRNCDMNKHMKRHTKPYGCTFGQCDKAFGSKNDWKRHENSQHFQIGLWKCQQPKLGKHFDQCEAVFWSDADMISHLQNDHDLHEQNAKAHAIICNVGRNNQTRFWCGFCGQVIALHNTGVKAWDERFNHIDRHFMKDQLNVEDWVDPESYEKKKDFQKISDQKSQTDHDGRGSRSNIPTFQPAPRKRGASSMGDDYDTPGEKRSRHIQSAENFVTHCISLAQISGNRCTNCDHDLCEQCPTEAVK